MFEKIRENAGFNHDYDKYSLEVHAFLKVWTLSPNLKEELLEADGRGVIEGVTSVRCTLPTSEQHSPKEIRDALVSVSITLNPHERVLVGTGVRTLPYVNFGNWKTKTSLVEEGLLATHVLAPAKKEILVYLTNTSGCAKKIKIGQEIISVER